MEHGSFSMASMMLHFMDITGIMRWEIPASKDSWDFGVTALLLRN